MKLGQIYIIYSFNAIQLLSNLLPLSLKKILKIKWIFIFEIIRFLQINIREHKNVYNYDENNYSSIMR